MATISRKFVQKRRLGPRSRTQALFQSALQAQQQGKRQRAEQLCLQVLQAEPRHHQAMHHLGLIAHLKGENERAKELVEKAIQLNPSFHLYHFNLGNILHALDLKNEAAKCFGRAIELAPDHALSYLNLGLIHSTAGYLDRAEVLLQKARELQPGNVHAHSGLAAVFLRQQRYEEAARSIETILRLDPADGQARHFLAVLKGETTETSPKDYVAGLFDTYADRFEEHLVQGLRYRTPQLLREAVGRTLGEKKEAAWRVLDMGCGTGLCGPLFRDLAGHLKGVDLSPKMIEKAKERKVYDELRVEDLVETLRGEKGTLDLAVSSDVLIYVGGLEAVFQACGAALRKGGLFAFSTEVFQGEGYFLRPSGRYAHSIGYIEALAAKHGFSVLLREEAVIRSEKGKPISGHLYVLCKGQSAPQQEDLEVSFDPANIQDAYESALLHQQAGQLAQAEGLYRLILRHAPDHADALHYLGVLAHQTGHSEAAVELITQAIAKNATAPAYHTNLGLALHALGKRDEATVAMRKALELNPGNVKALNNLAYLLKIQDKWDEAEELLQRAVSVDPAFAEGHNNLAGLLARKREIAEAERHYKKAAGLNPEYPDAHRNLAGLLQAQGRHAEAAASWRRLLKLRPEDAEAQARLAECESKA